MFNILTYIYMKLSSWNTLCCFFYFFLLVCFFENTMFLNDLFFVCSLSRPIKIYFYIYMFNILTYISKTIFMEYSFSFLFSLVLFFFSSFSTSSFFFCFFFVLMKTVFKLRGALEKITKVSYHIDQSIGRRENMDKVLEISGELLCS